MLHRWHWIHQSYTWQDGVSQSFHIYILHKYVFKWYNWQLSSVCLQSSIRVQPENALLHKRRVVSLISNGLDTFVVMRWRTKKWKVDSQQKLSSGPLAWAACVLTTELWLLGNHQPSHYPLHILHRWFQFLLSHTWHPLSMCCQTLLGVNHKNLWEGVRMSSRLRSSVQCAVYIDLFQAMRSRHCEIMDLHTETQILHDFMQELVSNGIVWSRCWTKSQNTFLLPHTSVFHCLLWCCCAP